MNIRDRIFQKITEMNMTQKEFANKTGIPETTVSDWKKKKTNLALFRMKLSKKYLKDVP